MKKKEVKHGKWLKKRGLENEWEEVFGYDDSLLKDEEFALKFTEFVLKFF